MGIVRLSGHLVCATDLQAARVRAALPLHLDLTRAEPGCRLFSVEVTDDPLIWSVEEEFTGQEALAAHQARAASSDWAMQTAGITRNYVISQDPD